MTAYDNAIQANAVQDRKNYHTSKHYISIGEGLRKSLILLHNRKQKDNTQQYISNLHLCLWQNSTNIDKGLNKSKYRTIHLILPLRIKIEKISKHHKTLQAFISAYALIKNKKD